jgi:transcriptional regulator with XRE-family HTH domain
MTLEAARRNVKLRQKDVASALGVSKKTVGSWENGKTMPKADKIDAICKLYGVSYDNIKWKP